MTLKQALILTTCLVAFFAVFVLIGVGLLAELNTPDYSPICLNADLAICKR